MIVCPLCEHQQAQGAACDNCGKQLAPVAPINVAREVLPELEPTGIAGANANVAVERLSELDEHRVAAVAVVPESIPEMERTRFEAQPVSAEPIPEMERTAFPDDGVRTPLPKVLVCRYCGHQQATGILCDGCGNRMPAVLRRSEAAATESEFLACPSCGVPGKPGRRCLSCGGFVKVPEGR